MPSQHGFYRFEHSYLSRAGNKTRGKSGRFHLSAVASYISNANKVADVLAVNLPTDRGELYSQLNRHSASVRRANGRIAETFIISFDARMSDEHQREALNNFLMAATFEGQTRATAYRHGDNPENPHAHVILIDADENGEPVGHFSRSGSFRRENSPVKGNPTVWLRKTWQDECNAVLEEHEYDFRVDMRSNLDRGLAEAGKPRGYEVSEQSDKTADLPAEPREQTLTDHVPDVENMVPAPSPDNETNPEPAPECPPMPVEEEDPETYLADPEPPEDDMEKLLPREAVAVASDFHNELRELRHVRARRDQLEASLKSSERALATAEKEHHDAYMAKSDAEKVLFTSEKALKPYQTEEGKLRGFGVKLGIGRFTVEFKTDTRKIAEHNLSVKKGAEEELARKAHMERSTNEQVLRWTNAKTQAAEKFELARAELDFFTSRFGNGATEEYAESVLKYTARQYLDQIADRDEETGEAKEDIQLTLKDLLDTEQISESQYRDALEIIGDEDAIRALEEDEDLGDGSGGP